MKKAVSKFISAGSYAGVDCSVTVEFEKDHTLVSVYSDESDLEVAMRVRRNKQSSVVMNAGKESLTLENLMEDGDEANGAYTINESIQMNLSSEGELKVYAFRSYDYESGQDSDFEDVSCSIKR